MTQTKSPRVYALGAELRHITVWPSHSRPGDLLPLTFNQLHSSTPIPVAQCLLDMCSNLFKGGADAFCFSAFPLSSRTVLDYVGLDHDKDHKWPECGAEMLKFLAKFGDALAAAGCNDEEGGEVLVEAARIIGIILRLFPNGDPEGYFKITSERGQRWAELTWMGREEFGRMCRVPLSPTPLSEGDLMNFKVVYA